MTPRVAVPLLACAALASASCSPAPPESQLGDGCWYEGARPILKVTGMRATLLISGDIKEIGIKRQGDHASIYPGFYLAAPGMPDERALMDRPEMTLQAALQGRGDALELMIPVEGASETGLRRGKPC